jgi:hypothetical protein
MSGFWAECARLGAEIWPLDAENRLLAGRRWDAGASNSFISEKTVFTKHALRRVLYICFLPEVIHFLIFWTWDVGILG